MAASRRASLFPDFVGEMRSKVQARTWSRVFEDQGEKGMLAARMDEGGGYLLLDCIAAHGSSYGHYSVKVDEASFLTHVRRLDLDSSLSSLVAHFEAALLHNPVSVIGESDDGPARLLLSYKFSDLTLTSHFEAVRCSGVARATAELIMALPHYVSDIVPLTDAMHKHGVPLPGEEGAEGAADADAGPVPSSGPHASQDASPARATQDSDRSGNASQGADKQPGTDASRPRGLAAAARKRARKGNLVNPGRKGAAGKKMRAVRRRVPAAEEE